jgi:oligoribonuclease NrnB/cAMP/cGMP phosphodiesterase (DHH superfamily)
MAILIITDNDLDGACSALLFKHILSTYDGSVEIIEVADSNISSKMKYYYERSHLYKKIIILDLYIPDNIANIVDIAKTTIIDHHESHLKVKDRYSHAKVIIENAPSTAILIYKLFKAKLESKKELIQLIEIVNDYDSYELKTKDSLKLNAIYSSYNNPRVDNFISSFYDGMRPYNQQELNAIKIYFNKFNEQIHKPLYKGFIKDYSVIGVFADFAINEVAHYFLKKTNYDICIVVNLASQHVSFRKKKTCPAKLNILAEALCNGGGHEYASGGKINNKFLQFANTLQICQL